MKQLGLIWGIGGFLALLVISLWRLIPNTLQAFDDPLQWYHWLVLIANTLLMAYYEGYRGFQCNFSPRVAARGYYLHQFGRRRDLLLAPFFCMAYYAAPRRRVVASWILTVFIVLVVLLFQRLPQPLRGLLDAGVVLGLGWGVYATVVATYLTFTGHAEYDPELLSH